MIGRPSWLHRHRAAAEPITSDAQRVGAAELRELSTVFAAPRWLRDLGFSSWYLVGCFLVLLGLVWLLGLTATIVGPVVAGTILATVTSPIVTWFGRHRIGRGPAAGLVLLILAAIAPVVVVPVIGGPRGAEPVPAG